MNSECEQFARKKDSTHFWITEYKGDCIAEKGDEFWRGCNDIIYLIIKLLISSISNLYFLNNSLYSSISSIFVLGVMYDMGK